ncbi:3-methyl-2-oxobutanoate dehydrogenase [lipoamide] kinase, mitochondrial-like [Corticium candelabrum]|uniref:3-methyl-2-oxobutanoate dehydrogenase [lipoamide] kinase, mitochondrial-like n=1 Tax=Corticium candelabrum TaxID=121492 RepID=UPI002E25F463|nr:3-methyl-2-oxobutanoate dehydrogenase [lipoamide] kinase, mitochondrial-like [Corticium candelabrum]
MPLKLAPFRSALRCYVCRGQHGLAWSAPESYEELWKAVSSFKMQKVIANVAEKTPNRVTPQALMYAGKPGDSSYMITTANYLLHTLPVRLSRRIRQFQQLPFLVGCNPHIMRVHWLYIRSFQIISNFKHVVNSNDEMDFTTVLKDRLHDHKGVLESLALGFTECKQYISVEKMQTFLDQILTSRLGIRMLCEHHIAMHKKQRGYVGIINRHLSPNEVILRCADFARDACQHTYGVAPEVTVDGHVHVTFPYIAQPLEYILEELLKNSFRATVQFHKHRRELPPVRVTISNSQYEFSIRVSDRGGGIPHKEVPQLLQYSATTADEKSQDDTDVFSHFLGSMNPGPTAGPMAGFGYGFPTSRAYARYLGGDLQFNTMAQMGTDVFLRLKHFDDTFYI